MLPGVLFAATALLAPTEVALTVSCTAGQPLAAVPVRSGVPFALGQVADGDACALVDAAGRAVPCQARPIAHWYDGSVKWLLVDTQLDLPATGELRLKLTTGGAAGAAPAAAVRCEETAEALTLDTGAARFVFSKRRFGLPSEAWIGGRQVVAPGSELVAEVQHDAPGEPQEENWLREASPGPRERFTAAPAGDYAVTLENANALQATVKLSGWLVNQSGRRLIQYAIRAYAFAGRPELRVMCTLVYAGRPKEDFIRALYLRCPRQPGASSAAWELGGQASHQGALRGDEVADLVTIGPDKIYHLAPSDQDKSVTYTVTANGGPVAQGVEALGTASVADEQGLLQLAVRDFWQMHPKQLRVRRDGLTVYLWPEGGNKVLDLRRRYDGVENTYHYDLSAWDFGGEGVALTHELLLRPGAPDDPAAGAELAARLNHPAVLRGDPAYLAATNVCGPFAPADPERFPLLEAVQNVGLLWIDRNQRQFHWDGQVDYGDTLFHGYNTPSHYGYRATTGWCSRGYVGWLNDDGGLTNAIFLHWLRTGDPRSWRLAENMARHSMDVDTVHWCAEQPEEIGGGHRHDQQHWGNGARGYGTATHGILDYYLLTGNERALEVARETAGYHDRGRGEDEDRIGGLIRFWEITGEPYWKKRADELLAEELKVPADKPWRFVTWPHFRMVSNTSTGFVYYLSAAPPADSAKLREAIVASAENSLGHYLSSWRDVSYLPLVVTSLAWQATRERRYAEATAALVQRLPLPRPRTVESGYLSALETLPFGEFAAAVTGRWQINNIYMLTIHGLAQLPYAQAALAAAGLDEQGLFAVKRVDDPAEPFEEVLTPARMTHEQGFAYQVALTHACPADKSGRSNLILLENGQPLGPAHSAHADIRAQGGGRYSHWYSTQLWFSASDNSDPRTNGREYKVVSPAP